MVRAERTIKINDDPGTPALTRVMVWQGLVMKAENPLPFVPVISSCRVIERSDNGLVREIIDRGDPITERVTFFPERQVKFERLSGRVLGTILNEIIGDEVGALALRFTFMLEVEGAVPGSTAEQDFATEMEHGYLMAVQATLSAMRKLAADKALTTAS